MKALKVTNLCFVVLVILSVVGGISAEVAEAQLVSIQSFNYQNHYIRHRGFLGEITTIVSTLDRQDATFRIVPGLADGRYISFESVNYPGYYLRHQGFRLKLHIRTADRLFQEDATFRRVPGLANSSWSSFESYNYPGRFIRHRNFHLYLEGGNTHLFRKDVTFSFISPMISGSGTGGGHASEPWRDPSVRQLIDEWLRQVENCTRRNHPASYIDRWGRICGEVTTGYIDCSRTPDHPAGWDNYQYLWNHNWCHDYYSHALQNYVRRRQSGAAPTSLTNCKPGRPTPCYGN